MQFKEWLESRTYAHDIKVVYHWDIESDFYKVLRKQGTGRDEYGRIMLLWVSPNKHSNEIWANHVGDVDNKKTFYLHKIGMPKDLFNEYVEREKTQHNALPSAFRRSPLPELAIMQKDWSKLIPISTTPYYRSEMLKLSSVADRRINTLTKTPQIPRIKI